MLTGHLLGRNTTRENKQIQKTNNQKYLLLPWPVVDRHPETLIYVDRTFVSKGHKQASRRVKSKWSSINPFSLGLHLFQLYLLRTMAMYQIISWWLGHKASENVVMIFWGCCAWGWNNISGNFYLPMRVTDQLTKQRKHHRFEISKQIGISSEQSMHFLSWNHGQWI